jgi:predicted ABC-class ATPase
MRDKKEFYSILSSIEGQPFSEYTAMIGDFDFSRYVLKIGGVQEQPDTGPTLFVIRVPQIIAGFPLEMFNTPVRRTALEDLLTRKVASYVEMLSHYDSEGIARRRIAIAHPGQKILPRSALAVTEEYVEARVYIELPEQNGIIPGDGTYEIFFEDLPGMVNAAMIYCNLDEQAVREAVMLMEDADQIRQVLPTRGLVGFIADGSYLTRQQNTDMPDYEHLDPLVVTEECRVTMEAPNAGSVAGVGIPSGITLVLGDEYSGRKALLHAVAAGIYNHVSGDGRERAITVPDAVYISAMPGRSIQRVDLTAFMNESDGCEDPGCFSTEAADAYASQAASTVEALEVGARVLIFDEADSCPAFLSRDSRLSDLRGSVTHNTVPLAARARQMVEDLGVSLVIGGSATVSEFIPLADTVLYVENHKVVDVTRQAKECVAAALGADDPPADLASLVEKARWVIPSSIDPSLGRLDAFIEAPALDALEFGRSLLDLSGVLQIGDVHQTATIGLILYYARMRYMDEERPMREILDLVDRDLSTEGLECLSRELRGDLARPRRYEIAAVMNRLDTLRITYKMV